MKKARKIHFAREQRSLAVCPCVREKCWIIGLNCLDLIRWWHEVLGETDVLIATLKVFRVVSLSSARTCSVRGNK